MLWNQSIEQYEQLHATDDPDLSPFKEQGGKVLILHGLADQLIPPQGSINYFETVQAKMGGTCATAEFAHLFFLPALIIASRVSVQNQLITLLHWFVGLKKGKRRKLSLRN